MSEQEVEVQADAKADVAFFLNLALLAYLLGPILAVDGIVWGDDPWYAIWLSALLVPLAYLLYRASIGAAQRWGSTARAAVDLHRLELYEGMGVREPNNFTEERQLIGPAVSRCCLYGTHLPDELARPPDEKEDEKEGEQDA